MEKFTVTQIERISELNGDAALNEQEFETAKERDLTFREIEKKLSRQARQEIKELLDEKHVTDSVATGHKLEEWLQGEGYTKVVTPTIVTREMLSKMSLTAGHALLDQVFWVDKNKALRPMHAPNLYIVMRELHRITNAPVKIYEIGSCFRKESQGAQHLNEFTMLNCVELAAIEDGKQMDELIRLAKEAMKVLGVPEEEYKLVTEESTVYGSTLDIEINGMEVASGSFGPHFLDAEWGVTDTWVGIGFGIERLTMALNKGRTIKRYGRSITFIDGKPMSI